MLGKLPPEIENAFIRVQKSKLGKPGLHLVEGLARVVESNPETELEALIKRKRFRGKHLNLNVEIPPEVLVVRAYLWAADRKDSLELLRKGLEKLVEHGGENPEYMEDFSHDFKDLERIMDENMKNSIHDIFSSYFEKLEEIKENLSASYFQPLFNEVEE